jgi:hypothetical protein
MRGTLPEGADELTPVHPRHVEIEQNGVERCGGRVHDDGDGRMAVFYLNELVLFWRGTPSG